LALNVFSTERFGDGSARIQAISRAHNARKPDMGAAAINFRSVSKDDERDLRSRVRSARARVLARSTTAAWAANP
jgi:hypothetical protein